MWTKNIPTESGHYWMWTDQPGRVGVPPPYTGWSFDKNPGPGLHWRPKPVKFFVKLVQVDASIVGHEYVRCQEDGYPTDCADFDAWWMKAEVPEPPKV